MKKIILLFVLMISALDIAQAQTATKEIVSVPKLVSPVVSINEYRDFNTGELERYRVFFQDNNYTRKYSVFSISFNTKEEMIEWFEGLMEYYDKKYNGVSHTYGKHRISMSKGLITLWDNEKNSRSYVRLTKFVATKALKQLKK